MLICLFVIDCGTGPAWTDTDSEVSDGVGDEMEVDQAMLAAEHLQRLIRERYRPSSDDEKHRLQQVSHPP